MRGRWNIWNCPDWWRLMFVNTRTFAVQLTPQGSGAIAVILVAGQEAAAIVTCLTPRADGMVVGQHLHVSLWSRGRGDDRVLDDALVVRIAGDRFELHVHGGEAVVAVVMKELAFVGAVQLSLTQAAERGIFGKGIAAEVNLALPRARTGTGLRLLSRQSTDGLARWARKWSVWLETHASEPERPGEFRAAVQELLARSSTLMRLLIPARVAIIGPPNAGKSTLANALLGRPVAITSDIAGTTRDWVDAEAIFTYTSAPGAEQMEVPVTLVDTAGVRLPRDELELEAIFRTHTQATAADVLILLLDGSQTVTSEEQALVYQYANRNSIVVFNKSDLGEGASVSLPEPDKDAPLPQVPLHISAKLRSNLDALMGAVVRQLDLHGVDPGEPFVFAESQRELLREVLRMSDATACRKLLAEWVKIA